MSTFPPNPGGWFDSLRRIGESFLSLMRSRFELFTVELQEEKVRLLNLLIWVVLTATIGVSGLLVGMAAIALWLWESAGYAGLIGLSLIALAVASGLFWGIHRKIQAGPLPFAQTTAEFRKDHECLRKNN